jgi:hypothetical protein
MKWVNIKDGWYYLAAPAARRSESIAWMSAS